MANSLLIASINHTDLMNDKSLTLDLWRH